ncbi:hypothetical protein QLH32_17610 [Acinetobacter corruptisaponis]|uniref:Zinc-ribbon domain-containing protein n=1 Tax=Acinetobacter corruptisaponis TaxID=3045147 RepID=A0ABY8S384_9GAMM|nr:hypothetical protein [Acinetobacter sp. KCTC 92772]WHP05796.1 hypothetical protein QLH32_17610 [Acinetobacter sp. KCTC 92772]
MALINCKECGAQVSTQAKACPSCGIKIKKNISLGAFLVIIILSILVFRACSDDTPVKKAGDVMSSQEEPRNNEEKLDVQILAKRLIKNSAKDPESVEFRNITSNFTEKFGNVACGEFNAKNGFGGYNGFKRFIANDKTLFVDGENNTNIPFDKMWIDAC